jgi:PAP2 superfamily protein
VFTFLLRPKSPLIHPSAYTHAVRCVAFAAILLALPTPSAAQAIAFPAFSSAQQDQPPSPQDGQEGTTGVQAGVGKTEGHGFVGSLVHNLADDVKHIPRKNTLYWLAYGTGLGLAIHPGDQDINDHLSDPDLDALFKPGKYIGSFPFMFGSAVATYIVGKVGDHPRAKHLGGDLIEATLLSEGITQGIKQIVRRDRPIARDGSQASGFSFPSGHASVTFAAATVFQQHLGWRAAVPTYLVASYVAMSRLHDERHFASDVVAGAAEGIIIGRSVTWHGRNFYGIPVVAPGQVGMVFTIDRSRATRP